MMNGWYVLYAMDNYILASLRSLSQGCFEVGPGYIMMTNLHLVFNSHLTWWSYLLIVCGVVFWFLKLFASAKAVAQWCRDQTTSPKGWPKLFPSTGPVASCERITKGSRIKSNIVMQFKLNTDILNLKSLFSIPDKQLKQFDSFFIILEYWKYFLQNSAFP